MKYKKSYTTIYSVAAHAGVSPATVSRVLSGSGYSVSAETKERVLASASFLGYNTGGATKKLHRNIIAVIIPNLINPYYTSLIMGLEYSLRDLGMSMLLMNTAGSLELEKGFIVEILRDEISGVIISPVGENCDHLRDLEKQGVNMVVMEQAPDIDCNRVSFNYKGGGIQAVQYLIGKGCKTIGFIGSPLTRYGRREIFAGYLSALENNGIVKDDRYIRIAKEEYRTPGSLAEVYEYSNGISGVQSMIESGLPEALFCANDITAIGAIQVLQKNGLAIPRDISVIGSDNIPFSAMIYPSLTTIDQSIYEMGSMSAEIMAGKINDKNRRNISATLDPRLIIRNSTV
jgi:LacI family transcriptional regulator